MSPIVRLDRVAILGLGEAGTVFARVFRECAGAEVAAFDILSERRETATLIELRAEAVGVRALSSPEEALQGAGLVVSLVTASSATDAACRAASALESGAVWLDLNSVRPETKRRIADTVEAAGGTMVEGVAMDTVPACGAKVPLLLCGPRSASLAATLTAAGMNATAIGPDYGLASAVKLCRSIVVKGMEAVLTEALFAAAGCGARDLVVASLTETFPTLDWRALESRFKERMTLHGIRRASEMLEAAAMLREMGLPDDLCAAIAESQSRGAG